jgi:hypothetical protein
MGAYPDKALGVLRGVALRMEEWLRAEQFGGVHLPSIAATRDGRVSEEVRVWRVRLPSCCVSGLLFCWQCRWFAHCHTLKTTTHTHTCAHTHTHTHTQ